MPAPSHSSLSQLVNLPIGRSVNPFPGRSAFCTCAGWLCAAVALLAAHAPQAHAEIDALQSRLRRALCTRVYWDNVTGPPQWLAGERPVPHPETGLSAVRLPPGGQTMFLVPPFRLVRILNPYGPLDEAGAQIELSNGSGLWAPLTPVASSDGRSLYADLHNPTTMLLRVSRPVGCRGALTLAVFTSTSPDEREPAPYRELMLPRDRRCLVKAAGDETGTAYVPVSPHRPLTLSVAGPTRLAVATRLRFCGDEGEPLRDYQLRVSAGGRLRRVLEYEGSVEYRRHMTVNGRPEILGRRETAWLDVPAGRHKLVFDATAPVYVRVLRQPRSDYLLPQWNAPLANDQCPMTNDQFLLRPRNLPLVIGHWSLDIPSLWHLRAADFASLAARLRPPGTARRVVGRCPVSDVELAARRAVRDNSRRDGPLYAYLALRELAEAYPGDVEIRREADRLLRRHAFFRNLPPAEKPHRGTQRYGWFIVRRLRYPHEQPHRLALAGQHLDDHLDSMSEGFFVALASSRGAASRYRLPDTSVPTFLRIAVDVGSAPPGLPLLVQFDGRPPIRLTFEPPPGAIAVHTMPAPADGALAALTSGNRKGGRPHFAMSQRRGAHPRDAKWSRTPFQAPVRLVDAAVLELTAPSDVREVRVWSPAAGARRTFVALQFRASRTYRLTARAYREMARRAGIAEFGERLFTAALFDRPYVCRDTLAERELRNHWTPLIRRIRQHGREFAHAIVPLPEVGRQEAGGRGRGSGVRGQRSEVRGQKSEATRQEAGGSRKQAAGSRQSTDHGQRRTEDGQSRSSIVNHQSSISRPSTLDPGPSTLDPQLLREARRLAAEEQWLPALEAWSAVLAAAEGDAALRSEALFGRITALEHLGEEYLAETHLKSLFLYDRDASVRESARRRLAVLYRRKGDDDARERLAAAALLRNPQPERITELARILLERGEVEDAMALNDQLSTLNPQTTPHSPLPAHQSDVWSPADQFVVDYDGAALVYSVGRDNYSQYWRAAPERPVRLTVPGPARLRLELRPLHPRAGDSLRQSQWDTRSKSPTSEPLDDWALIRGKGRMIAVPITGSRPADGLRLVGHAQRPGWKVSREIDLTPGPNEIEVLGESRALLLRAFVSPRDLTKPSTRQSSTVNFRAGVTGETALGRLEAILRRYETQPEQAVRYLVTGERLAERFRDVAGAQDVRERLTRHAVWKRVTQIKGSAGLRTVEIEGWKPETPALRVRRALLPKLRPDENVVVGAQRLLVRLRNEGLARLTVHLSMLDPAPVRRLPLTAAWQLDDGPRRTLELATSARSFTLGVPAGLHTLRVWSANPVANQFLCVRVVEHGKSGAESIMRKLERLYHVATRDEPLRVALDGPAWVRIDERRDGTTLVSYRYVEPGAAVLTLAPAEGRSEALFRVFQRTVDPERQPVPTRWFPQPVEPVPPSHLAVHWSRIQPAERAPRIMPPSAVGRFANPSYAAGGRYPPDLLALRDETGFAGQVFDLPATQRQDSRHTPRAARLGGDAIGDGTRSVPATFPHAGNLLHGRHEPPASVTTVEKAELSDPAELFAHGNGTWSLGAGWFSRRPLLEGIRFEEADEFVEGRATHRRYYEWLQSYTRSDLLFRDREDGGFTLGLEHNWRKELGRLPLTVDLDARGFLQLLGDDRLPHEDTEWALHFRGGAYQVREITPRAYHVPSLQVFARLLSLEKNLFPAGVIDQDVFTEFKNDHRHGLVLADRLVHRPWLDAQWFLRPSLVTNEDFKVFDPDHVALSVGWEQWVRPVAFDVIYRVARFFDDGDRRDHNTQHLLSLDAVAEWWMCGAWRVELGMSFQRDLSRDATSAFVFLELFRDAGWNDFHVMPGEKPFLDLRRLRGEERLRGARGWW